MNNQKSLLKVQPRIPAPLDPGFVPAVLARRNYSDAVKISPKKQRMAIAAEREDGCICRCDVDVLQPGSGFDADTIRYVERHIKFILWGRGGWKLYLSGPELICREIVKTYSPDGRRSFDAQAMGKAYDQAFTVRVVEESEVPETKELDLAVGGHLDGCRIGFDLGASDYKLAAVIDGASVFSTEKPWHPSVQKDPAYHYSHIMEGLKETAARMPRLDGIGGSSAGIIVNNQVKAASLFRSVPEEIFNKTVKPIFLNVQKEFGVPLVVINDGDVTALAGAMSLKRNAMLGVAMGSSEAAGYLNPKGRILGYLNELAFTPVDFNENAARDEWSGDVGTGALYFSQQAVNKLAPAAGFSFPAEMLLPERLKYVQEKANKGDKKAEDIFVTIGVYLGYTVPLYAEYYDFENMLVLGRVTSGRGGELLMETAEDVLKKEFPEVAERVELHIPDEKSRRVGQAVAAASLPEISKKR